MPSNAFAGVGTIFLRNGVPVAEINNINGPSKTRDSIDVTSLDSAGGYREFIGGFKDGGEVSFTMNFTRDGYILLNDDYESSDLQNYSIRLPDQTSTQFDFFALVTAIGLGIPMDDKVVSDITLKVSGQVIMNS